MEKDYIYRLLYGLEQPEKGFTLADLFKPLDPPRPVAKPHIAPFGQYGQLSDLLGSLPPPPSPTSQTGIRFGDCGFCEPFIFTDSQTLPSDPGLYVALAYDQRCKPRPYRSLYFGKAAKLSERVGFLHEKWSDWQRAATPSPVYIAYCAMPWSTDDRRRAIEEGLIKEYAPKCNDVHNPWGGRI